MKLQREVQKNTKETSFILNGICLIIWQLNSSLPIVNYILSIFQVLDEFHFTEPSTKQSHVPTATVHPLPSSLLGPSPMEVGDSGPEAYSKSRLNIQNIDANDKENPQLVSDYVNDIYEYMRELEVKLVMLNLRNDLIYFLIMFSYCLLYTCFLSQKKYKKFQTSK